MNINQAIKATFKDSRLLAIKKEIRKKDDTWGWHCGGCYGVANALTPIIKDARKMSVAIYDGSDWELPWATEHAVVKVGEDYYDGRGVRTLKQLQKEYFTKNGKHDIKPYRAKGVWYADDYFLSEHYSLIRKIFKKYVDKKYLKR